MILLLTQTQEVIPYLDHEQINEKYILLLGREEYQQQSFVYIKVGSYSTKKDNIYDVMNGPLTNYDLLSRFGESVEEIASFQTKEECMNSDIVHMIRINKL